MGLSNQTDIFYGEINYGEKWQKRIVPARKNTRELIRNQSKRDAKSSYYESQEWS